jgi:hypothetical protein
MKRLVAIVLVVAMTAGCALPVSGRGPRIAHGAWMWDNVVSLPPDALLRVYTSGTPQEGTFISADDVHLRLGTKYGAVVIPAAVVQRVDRLMAPTHSRGERALRSAAVGTAASVGISMLTMAFLCAVMGGRPCWAPPPPRAVAGIAAFYGGVGAISGDSPAMTVYRRP